MKVLYNATYARVGGGLSYSRDQIRALGDIADLDVTVLVSPWNQEALSAAAPGRVEVRLVRTPNVPLRFLWEQTLLPIVARAFDVLISPGNFGALVCPVPQVVVLQNPNYVGRGRRLPQNASWRRRAKIAMSHAGMRRSDLVVAISRSLTAEVRSEPRLADLDLVTVRSGAPPTSSPPDSEGSPAAPPGADDGAYLLSVANDYPHKRLGDLAELARILVEGSSDAPRRVLFAGDVADDRQDALRRAAGRGADGLVFLGPVAERVTVMDLYRRAAVAISTSELEAWPLTLHEARSQGAPLVVTDIAPHRELVEGQARFFPVGDVEALRGCVEEVVRAPRPEVWAMDRSWTDHGSELADALRALVASR